MIKGVKTKNLKFIPDERGRLMEILRSDDELFSKFGQIYLTTNYPKVVKAWHFHKHQVDNICCIKGMIKVVLYDARRDSPTRGEINEFFIGDFNPMLVQIPKEVFHGWKCISKCESLVLNMSTEKYNHETPDEFRMPFNTRKIPYDWEIKMR